MDSSGTALGARLAELPVGPELFASLSSLDFDAVPAGSCVEVMQASARLLAAAQALHLQAIATVLERDPAGGPSPVARLDLPGPYASDEVRAALTLTRRSAAAESEFAWNVVRVLPEVHAAMLAGVLDRGRAWVFAHLLADQPADIIDKVLAAVLPVAPSLTTGQLRARILKLIITADPDHAENEYAKALAKRSFVRYLDRNGSAVLSGTGLPADEAAAAAARVVALAAAVKRAGHPGLIDQIRADMYLRLLDGSFEGKTREQMIAAMLDPTAVAVGPVTGVEVRARLDTLAGLNALPGELPGYGPILASTARTLVTRQHRAEWRWVVTDTDGYLLAEGTTRRRPATGPPDRIAEGGIVELAIPASMLARLAKDPPPAWAPVITDIAARFQHTLTDPSDHLDAQPRRRHPRRALRRHTQIRDRTCTAPTCRQPATQSDQDHTTDYQHGGHTTRDDLGPACPHDHHLKHQGGWTVTQHPPGHFVWISPLGHTYPTRGEPITDPEPAEEDPPEEDPPFF